MMNQAEIHASLDAMLTNPKSRNFLNHLVRAYIPISNTDKVWDKPKGPFRCALTKVELISVQEVLEGMQTDEFKDNFKLSLKHVFDETVNVESPMVKLIGEKFLGCTGTNTTTFMSYPAVQEFYNWVITKSLKNDKHINWLLKTINKESFLSRAELIQDDAVQKKVKAMKKEETKAASFTLGELDSFKKLREQFND